MARYEYKVIPAPVKGVKARGVRTTEARFANALQAIMNEAAADGWAYLRSDTLPCEERSGLLGSNTVYQNMLVFQREMVAAERGVAVAGLGAVGAPALRLDRPARPAPVPVETGAQVAGDDLEPEGDEEPAVEKPAVASRIEPPLSARIVD